MPPAQRHFIYFVAMFVKIFNMKYLFFLTIAAVTFSSCDKSLTVTPAAKDKPVEKTTANPILGKWAYAHDTARSFTIDSIVGAKAYFTFDYTIESPNKGPFQMVYNVQLNNGITYFTNDFIYPGCQFSNDGANGWAIEHLKVPTQGDMMPLVRK